MKTFSNLSQKTRIALETRGLDVVNRLQPISYSVRHDPSVKRTGFVEERVHPMVPEAITRNKYEEWNLDMTQLVPVLWKAVQELSTRVETLEKENVQQGR